MKFGNQLLVMRGCMRLATMEESVLLTGLYFNREECINIVDA